MSVPPVPLHPLDTEAGQQALDLAASQGDPASLAAATALRQRFAPELAASALHQESLRRRARSKFGDRAAGMLFTSDGLEQATRPVVSAWRARRFAEAGVSTVVDLGCGIGADAMAFADAGLDVVAVELDPTTAGVAAHNLRGREARVLCGDAVALAPQLLDADGVAVFCDPARRTDRGRTWQVDQFRPPWDFVLDLLSAGRPTCVKMGPGLPGELVPDACQARWVSVGGDVVEAGLWTLPGLPCGRAASLLEPVARDAGGVAARAHELGPLPRVDLPTSMPRTWLYEPDGAVLRAGLAGHLGAGAGLHQLAAGVGYLTSDELIRTPFATAFEVLEVLDAGEKALRAWVRANRVGTLEIKKRAVEVDPAALRRRLRPAGPNRATLVLTPTPRGTRCLVVRRASEPGRR